MQRKFTETAAPRAIVVDGDVLSKEETIDIAKRASAKTSLLDAEDAYDLLSTYWNTAFLQSITDDNYEEQVKSFNNILSEKIRNSGTNIIQRKFNKYRGNISQNYRAK